MKNSCLFIFSILLVVLLSNPSCAQEDKTLRPSPPAEVHAMVDVATVSIQYSSPSVKGRDIWGGLVPYGKVWRTGANEATVFETDQDLTIQEQKLPAGKYGLFTIPGKTEWTFIFNSAWDQWGAFKYNEKMDVLRIVGNPEPSSEFHERMKFEISGNQVILFWENLKISFEVGR